MIECLHKPTVRPGLQCECFECRTARMQAFSAIAHHCTQCSGRCRLDERGQVSCDRGDYKCPVLDLWLAAATRVVEPGTVNAAEVEVVHRGEKPPPKRYRRIPPGSKAKVGVIDPRLLEARPRRKK